MTDQHEPDEQKKATPVGEGPTVPLKRPPAPEPGLAEAILVTPGEAAPREVTPPDGSTPREEAEPPEVTTELDSHRPKPTRPEDKAVDTAVDPAVDPYADPAAGPAPAGGEPAGGDNGPADEPTGNDKNPGEPSPEPVTSPAGEPSVPKKKSPWHRLRSAGALIWVLLALFGFTLVVQLRSNNSDEGLASARQDDLVRILSDLEARDTRLQAEIAALETSQRQLTSGVAGRQAALAEADKRADELGLLAGTLAGRGRGLDIRLNGVKASAILNAVQELRGAGGEVMQLSGSGGDPVRIVASTYFVEAENGGIKVDGKRLTGPYQLLVIGVPQTMQTALEIPGGVVASVQSGGGSVTMEQRDSVEVTALRDATSLQYARPVS